MDGICKVYLWASVLIAILFFILSSNILYWITNRVSTTLYGPTLYNFSRGGSTLAGLLVHSLLFFGIVFGIIDYVYGLINGDDDTNVTV
jgi:hypothetical protein